MQNFLRILKSLKIYTRFSQKWQLFSKFQHYLKLINFFLNFCNIFSTVFLIFPLISSKFLYARDVQQLPAWVWRNTQKKIPKNSGKKIYGKVKSIFQHIHQVNRGSCYNVRPVFLFRDGRTMGPFSRRTTKFLCRVHLPTRSPCPLGGLSMPETDDSHWGQGPGIWRVGKEFPFEFLEYGTQFAIGRFIICSIHALIHVTRV